MTGPNAPGEPVPFSALAPLLLAVTEDVFLVPRLEDAARAAGFDLRIISRPEDLGAGGDPAPRAVPLTEPLQGPDAALVRQLVEQRPALILIDVTSRAVPWAHWISVLKSGSATRRIPLLAFGPHVDRSLLDEATRNGADRALARGAFLSDPKRWIETSAARPDVGALEAACREPLSDLGRHGLDLFNQGEFFQAHEALEHAFLDETDAAGQLYRVLLQLAVACLHLQRNNRPGAAKMLLRIRPWLDPLPDRCRGVDLAAVRQLVGRLQRDLDRLPAGESTAGLNDPAPVVPWASSAS
jgi:hypothetical protein